MRYDTKDFENIKCETTFSEWKEEVNSNIRYNKSEMKKRIETELNEIKQLKKEIKECKKIYRRKKIIK